MILQDMMNVQVINWLKSPYQFFSMRVLLTVSLIGALNAVTVVGCRCWKHDRGCMPLLLLQFLVQFLHSGQPETPLSYLSIAWNFNCQTQIELSQKTQNLSFPTLFLQSNLWETKGDDHHHQMWVYTNLNVKSKPDVNLEGEPYSNVHRYPCTDFMQGWKTMHSRALKEGQDALLHLQIQM